MSYALWIKQIGRGARGASDLDGATAQALFGAMLDGQIPELELGALLLALRIKGESADELCGFVAAMQARSARLDLPQGPRCVVLPSFNGARKQANLMPLVALLLARAGVPVLIHGRHDFDSRHSPFELLEALGLHRAASLDEARAQLMHRRLAVAPLPLLCPGLDALLALRPRLGVRSSAHSVAKLLDPAPGRTVRVVAVTHPEYLDSMATALPRLCADAGRALLMRASEGEAYAHLRRRALLRGFVAGRPVDLHAPDSNDLDWPLSSACEPVPNARLIEAMLDGREPVPPRILEQVEVLQQLSQQDLFP